MNIVYLHSHDSGRWIAPYGCGVPTPNLMRLAREGTLFRQAYCAAPTCSPSRAALLTGQTAHGSGMLGLAHRGFALKDPARHLARVLKSQGYETALAGVQHECDDKAAQAILGYDPILSVPNEGKSLEERDLANARRAAEYLRSRKRGPFFLAFGTYNTHRPYPDFSGRVDPGYVAAPAQLPDRPEVRRDMAGYVASAQVMDAAHGIVLDALREFGLENETFVFFTTDHGPAFPRMKCSLYDPGIAVALLIKFPGNPAAGRVLDELVSQVDVFPTLVEAAGIVSAQGLEGRSLLPLLRGEPQAARAEIFAEVTYHAAYEPQRCIRTERHKLIRRYGRNKPVLPNMDAGESKTFLLEQGFASELLADEELYDLFLDPAERVNLVASREHQTLRGELGGRLERWMRETGDPLLQGAVPQPQGARIEEV